MSCPVCASASVGSDLCAPCGSMTVKVEAVAHVSTSFRGSDRSQVRDRQWLFKHAKEAIAKGDSTVADLTSICDRIPHSKRGTALRNKLNKRIAELSSTFNPVRVGAYDA